MLAGILARWSHIDLAGDPVWSPRMVLRSVDQLPVTFQS